MAPNLSSFALNLGCQRRSGWSGLCIQSAGGFCAHHGQDGGSCTWCSALPGLPHPRHQGHHGERGRNCSCIIWAAQLVPKKQKWIKPRWARGGYVCLAAFMRTSEQRNRLVFLQVGEGSGGVDFSYCCFISHCCCRHVPNAEQGTEMRPFRVTAETLHCDLPLPLKAYRVLRLVPTDFTHGVSSSSHDFRIQSHLFTCDSHVCDCVFQAHVNNM